MIQSETKPEEAQSATDTCSILCSLKRCDMGMDVAFLKIMFESTEYTRRQSTKFSPAHDLSSRLCTQGSCLYQSFRLTKYVHVANTPPLAKTSSSTFQPA